MKIRLNGFEVKLKSSRLKIYDLLKNGNRIVIGSVNYLIVNQNGQVLKQIKSNAQAWTIELMRMDKLILYNGPSTLILNPLIEEIK